jgi:hypothetical protein
MDGAFLGHARASLLMAWRTQDGTGGQAMTPNVSLFSRSQRR